MPNRQNQKGRSKLKGTFAHVPNDLIRSEAWRHTSLAARALLVEVAALYGGGNNGSLVLSVRYAADRMRCSKDTVSRAFRELKEHGILEATYQGKFSLKEDALASEWRLTWRKCDKTSALPSNAYRFWHPPLAPPPTAANAARFANSRSDLRDNAVRSQGRYGPISGTAEAVNVAHGPISGTKTSENAISRSLRSDTSRSTMGGYDAGRGGARGVGHPTASDTRASTDASTSDASFQQIDIVLGTLREKMRTRQPG